MSIVSALSEYTGDSGACNIDAKHVDVEHICGQENLQTVIDRMTATIIDLQIQNKYLQEKLEVYRHTGKYGYK